MRREPASDPRTQIGSEQNATAPPRLRRCEILHKIKLAQRTRVPPHLGRPVLCYRRRLLSAHLPPCRPSRRRSLHLTDSGPQHFLNFLPEPLRRLQSRAARGYGVPSFRRKPLTPSGPAFNSRSMSGYVTSSPAVRSPITRKMASFCVRFRK